MFPTGFDDHRHSIPTELGEVSHVRIGHGPAALFVHGIATNAYLWQNLIPLVADLRECIALDLPLHGRSPLTSVTPLTVGAYADTLAQFCDRLGLDGVDLVAHDTGGAIAQVFAARHPELIRSLTLTNCETQDNIPPAAMNPTVEAARAGQLAATVPAVLGDPAASRAFFATGYQDQQFLSDDLVRAFLEPVVGTPESAARFEELLAGLGPEDLRAAEPALRTLTAPTLIAWATDDEFFDLKWAHWLQATIPGAREVVEIPDGKLFFPHERAPELATLIRQHWTASGA